MENETIYRNQQKKKKKNINNILPCVTPRQKKKKKKKKKMQTKCTRKSDLNWPRLPITLISILSLFQSFEAL